MSNSDPTSWFLTELAPHESALRAYLHGLVPPSDVDDIIQETYARILRAFERGPIESPRGLLFATARNVARDLFRRRTTANTIPIAEIDEARVFDGAPNAAENATRRQETDLLASAIAALPPRCREILVLRKFARPGIMFSPALRSIHASRSRTTSDRRRTGIRPHL